MAGDEPKRRRMPLKTFAMLDLPLDLPLKSRMPATTKTNALNIKAYRPPPLQEGSKYKAERLKKTKFTLLHEQKQKAKKTTSRDYDSLTDSPEVQLLIRLFIPSKFLIKNDKLSMKQLSAHLPMLVKDTMPKLNLELHLFLSTVVSRYVSSWYLGKLNTQNLDFIHQVYQIMCDVVKSLATRIGRICNGKSLVELVDKCANDINEHIRALVTSIDDKEDIRILATRGKAGMVNTTEAHHQEIITSFLAANHVIFNHAETSLGDLNSEQDDPLEPESPELVYLRILVRKILLATFDDDETTGATLGPGITNSVITMNLVTILVADLVLEKTLGKLSSPDFICYTVIGNIVGKIRGSLEAKPNSSKTPVGQTTTDRIKQTMYKAYMGLVSAAVAVTSTFIAKTEGDESASSVSILDLAGFELLDTITGISQRKPLAANFMRSVRALISMSGTLSRRVDAFLMGFLESKVSTMGILRDSQMARVVRGLRGLLFDDSRNEQEADVHKTTIEGLTDDIYQLVTSVPSATSSLSFRYQNETDEELREAIRKVLVIFNYSAACDNNELHETSDLNKLLVIKLLDHIVSLLYPELLV